MIDWQRVSELRDEIGADDFEEVVELFLDEVGSAIQQIPQCQGDAKLSEEQMHFLKGAALNLGFSELSDLCAKAEQRAKGGDDQAVKPDVVAACFEQSKEAFFAGFHVRFAA